MCVCVCSQMLLVTGGWTGSSSLDSTESLLAGAAAWKVVTTGRLPRPMDSPALTTLDNVLFLLGNFSYPNSVSLRWLYIEGGKDYNDEFGDILSFDPVKEIWMTVGHMAQRRREHAVTSLSAEQTEDLLNFCYQ